MAMNLVLKGQVLSFAGDPFSEEPDTALRFESAGAVHVTDGIIQAVGPAEEIVAGAIGARVLDYGSSLISAGFVDCHAHYPQLPIIASYGEQLLEWLETYTFPCEAAFGDPAHAREAAELFLTEAVANGTTTACVYATVHPESVDAFFEISEARRLRMACGKVLMDRNAPENLLDTAQTGYDQSKTLAEKWHGRGRNIYAVTPRFAPTSTPEQLEVAGALWREHPGTLMQTHLSENPSEIAWMKELFPEAPDYFGVYQHFGLTGPGAIFGHAIHLTERERAALRTPVPPLRIARRPTCSSVRACSTWPGCGMWIRPSPSVSPAMSPAAPACPCSRPCAPPTRWRNCAATACTPTSSGTWRRRDRPRRWALVTGSAIWRPAWRPT